MKQTIIQADIQSRLDENPLLREMGKVMTVVDDVKTKARHFYFEVVLSLYSCPDCGDRLKMTGTSRCTCDCGRVLDPTLEFQKSACCDAGLVKKTFHYACSGCRQSVASRFIFDEKVFDRHYFRKMMRKARDRKKRKREEIRRLLAESRSETLVFLEEPALETIPGLLCDLDDFIQDGNSEFPDVIFENVNIFNIDQYWSHIQSLLGWNPIHFSEIPPLDDDYRRDRAYRFITLIYMQNDRKIDIEQEGNDLFVQRVCHEAHC